MLHNTPTFHKIFFTIAVVVLVGYGFFNSRFLLQGPEIVLAGIDPHIDVIRTDKRDFTLQGTVQHSSYITINNRPIMVDEAGNFTEKLLLSSGVSIIDIYARDKFGKEVREKIDVVYDGEISSSTIAYEQIALRVKGSGSNTATTTNETESSSIIATANEEITVLEPDPISSTTMTIMSTSTSSGF